MAGGKVGVVNISICLPFCAFDSRIRFHVEWTEKHGSTQTVTEALFPTYQSLRMRMSYLLANA